MVAVGTLMVSTDPLSQLQAEKDVKARRRRSAPAGRDLLY
jgi:hypothetical protein